MPESFPGGFSFRDPEEDPVIRQVYLEDLWEKEDFTVADYLHNAKMLEEELEEARTYLFLVNSALSELRSLEHDNPLGLDAEPLEEVISEGLDRIDGLLDYAALARKAFELSVTEAMLGDADERRLEEMSEEYEQLFRSVEDGYREALSAAGGLERRGYLDADELF